MPYFRIDDAWWSHPKTLALSPAARDLWVRAGSYSMQHFTDGLISKQALTVLAAKPAPVRELVDVGFWEQVLVGYQFHDWHDHQETAEHLKDRREKARERMRSVRANRARTDSERAEKFAQQESISIPSHLTHPGETRPVPETPQADRTDQNSPHPDLIEAAARLRVDFRKVHARFAEQAQDAVDPEATWRGIVTVVSRANSRAGDRTGDRTGLVLKSLRDDWAEWSKLAYAEALS